MSNSSFILDTSGISKSWYCTMSPALLTADAKILGISITEYRQSLVFSYIWSKSDKVKRSHIVGIVLIAVAIGVIISTYADTSTYADFNSARKSGDELHVVGTLVQDKPLFYDPLKDANYFSFYMEDEIGRASCRERVCQYV